MGPKTAPKVVEKVAPKDEAQVFYVTLKQTAPAPTPTAVAPSAASIVSATASIASAVEIPAAKPVPKSPKKEKEAPAPAVTAEANLPAPEEMQEASFEIIVNLLCRSDIVIDYIRRQFVKVIQEKLAAEDPEKKIGEALRTKLKNLQTDLTTKANSDLILRDAAGVDVFFKEVRVWLQRLLLSRINVSGVA